MRWTLEQLEVFVAVADGNSFSAVARRFGRVQSAVRTAVAALEDDLGVRLFERSSGRQPRLTEAGQALLEEARELLRQSERLEGRALGLSQGEEVCLRLAQDEALPMPPILDSLEALAQAFPRVEVQMTSGGQGVVARQLLERRADLGLLFHHEGMPAELERRRLGMVDMVMVCGAAHPLAQGRSVDRRELAQHRQLLITLQDSHYPGNERISPTAWRTDSFYVMAELLMRNLGWACLPRHVAQYPTYQGHLIELSSDWIAPPLPVELVFRRDETLGPAAQWLVRYLGDRLRILEP